MAFVQSHGLHEPSALRYLIAEGILPPDPSPESYSWSSSLSPAEDGKRLVQEEILTAQSCVVWSTYGVVRRVLNLGAEDEPILNAFTTSFETEQESRKADESKPSSIAQAEKALVVVLKSQAHILLLSGDTHILPLAFEVQSSFPCPYGFLLERKVDSHTSTPEEHSFHHDLSTINESQGTLRTDSTRPSLLLPDGSQRPDAKQGRGSGMPKTYSCTEVMSEVGLVVCGASTKPTGLEDCPALPLDEEIQYLSKSDEFFDLPAEHASLCIAVTKNSSTGKITLWHVARDVPPVATIKSRAKEKPRKSETSHRKSSNIYARGGGVIASAPRGPSKLRESFAGPAPLNAESLLHSSATEPKSSTSDDLAAQFGPGFGDVGVQTRSARRVSSMLARTDLGAGTDRGAFHDLAMGHATRKSLNRPGPRGESIGSFGDRQSFGRRRSSLPTNTSILSNGTSFLNVPGQLRTSILDPGRTFEDLDDSDVLDGGSHLPRNIGFFKLTSFFTSDDGTGHDPSHTYSVLTFTNPPKVDGQKDLSVCVLDQRANQIAIVNIQVEFLPTSLHTSRSQARLKATKIRRGSGIVGACLVEDESQVRLFILTKTRHGHSTLQLEAPWSAPFRVDLPPSLPLPNPVRFSFGQPSNRKGEERASRALPTDSVDLCHLQRYGGKGQLIATDSRHRQHLFAIKLQPSTPVVNEILDLSNLIFGTEFHDSLLVTLWEVMRWLQNHEVSTSDEWTALVVVLFSLAAPFLDEKVSKSNTPQKGKKGGLLRSSSGTAVDLTNFDAMQDGQLRSNASIAWAWLSNTTDADVSPARPPKHSRTQSLQSVADDGAAGRGLVSKCVVWAREFVQTPAGEAAIGPEGYLPISVNKDRTVRQTSLAKLLVGMHLLNEENRLNVVSGYESSHNVMMLPVLAQLGQWLGWEEWTMRPGSYYANESTASDHWVEASKLSNLDVPGQPFSPPSIFQYIADSLTGQPDESFPTLDALVEQSAGSSSAAERHSKTLNLTPRTSAILETLKTLEKFGRSRQVLDATKEQNIEPTLLRTLPNGVAAVLHRAMAFRNLHPAEQGIPTSSLVTTGKSNAISKLHLSSQYDATKDYHSVSVSAVEAENLQRWDASSEADRHSITRLIFQDDRRFQEASKLVNQTRPPVVECNPELQWSEADLLEAQKELAQFVIRRTLSVASGRGMMHFDARVPLLTERVPIPAFSLQCLMKARNSDESAGAMTFSADKASFTEDKVCWAFFHNGASAGLMISKDAKGIDTSWVLYNKPPELTNRHAGFLLALGLNGHLKTLAKWVAFKYLTPKHTMTSIGLLLGLSASYLGTQDQLITRMLSVHVTRLLPPGSTELNVSPLTQATGIMGIGLLYHNSQHRRMSEVMLSELENNDSEERTSEDAMLRDEGYRLAAGFSLGLINLGQGLKLHGLHDMAVVERLLTIGVGTKNVNLVHVLDRATAGAVMATALIFLKTNDEAIARKVDIPDTIHQFDYVRPDIFLLRTLARHLIMWDAIVPSQDFITASLPSPYRLRASLQKIKALHTEDMPFYNILTGILFALGLRFAGSQSPVVRDLLVHYLDQFLRLSRLPCSHYDARVTLNSVRNCVDVLALSTATVMAGSGDLVVFRRLRSLHGRTDRHTPFGSHMAAHMALGALFLGGGTMTFGTSDLAIAGLCIAFYPLFPGDVLDNKTHLQALRHLWVLAVEGRCLVARSAGGVVGGVEGHVKLRNGHEIIVRAPGLLPDFAAIQRLEVRGEGYCDVTLDFSDPSALVQIKTQGAVNVHMTRKAIYDSIPRKEPLLEHLDACEHERRMFGNTVPSVNKNVAMRTHGSNGTGVREGEPFEWLFELDSFKQYNHKERDLVLNSLTYLHGVGRGVLDGTVVDDKLYFERGCLPEALQSERNMSDERSRPVEVIGGGALERDKLWQLRILFAWFDRFEGEEEEQKEGEGEIMDRRNGEWLKREVVERLRDRVWQMAYPQTE